MHSALDCGGRAIEMADNPHGVAHSLHKKVVGGLIELSDHFGPCLMVRNDNRHEFLFSCPQAA